MSGNNNGGSSSSNYHASYPYSAPQGTDTTDNNNDNQPYQGSPSGWPAGYPPSGASAHAHYPPPNAAQYSTLANYDGSYSRRRSSLPPPPHGLYPNPSGMAPNGVPVVPSSVPAMRNPSQYPAPSSFGVLTTKSFICETCGQSFTRAHDRKRHSQIHTRLPDEGPRCQWCNKKFSRDDALKRHLDHGCEGMPDEVFEKCPLAPRD